MHEFGLCEGIIEAVRRRASGRRVARVKVRVGTMHRVDEKSFKQAFSWAAGESEAENAFLDLVVTSARAVCRTCKAETESADRIITCPNCGAFELDLVQGEEIILESIEYEAASGESK
jgi:hydrogenase nickel incorporation protein HypA/HybF